METIPGANQVFIFNEAVLWLQGSALSIKFARWCRDQIATIVTLLICFVDDTTEMSQDELRFMQNAKKKKTKLKDGHYQIPFKDHVVSVPNNKLQALSRIT